MCLVSQLCFCFYYSILWFLSYESWKLKTHFRCFQFSKLCSNGIFIIKHTFMRPTARDKSHQAHLFLLLSFSFFLSFLFTDSLQQHFFSSSSFFFFLFFFIEPPNILYQQKKKKHMATNFSNPNLENQTQKHELDHTHLHRNTNPQTCSPWVWLHSRRYFTISQTHKHPPWLPPSPLLLLLHDFLSSTSLTTAILEKKRKRERQIDFTSSTSRSCSCSREEKKKSSLGQCMGPTNSWKILSDENIYQ